MQRTVAPRSGRVYQGFVVAELIWKFSLRKMVKGVHFVTDVLSAERLLNFDPYCMKNHTFHRVGCYQNAIELLGIVCDASKK